ncbi:MAG: hypothetical protein IJ088_06905 [Clostridia bacterium]|nr:hypothetical protein [Clostridia bacterium]
MGIVYQKDGRSGITYAYDNHRVWSEEKGKYVNKRKLIGRVENMETKEIIPTDGRCKRRSPYLSESERTRIESEKPAEFMEALFPDEKTNDGSQKNTPDVKIAGNNESGLQSLIEAVRQMTGVLEGIREDLSVIKNKMG